MCMYHQPPAFHESVVEDHERRVQYNGRERMRPQDHRHGNDSSEVRNGPATGRPVRQVYHGRRHDDDKDVPLRTVSHRVQATVPEEITGILIRGLDIIDKDLQGLERLQYLGDLLEEV